MPAYEYECKKCGGHFEEIQKFSDKPLTKCEECGGRLEKLMSLSSFHLKGTGWYKTDYAKSGAKPEACGAKKDAKDPSASGSKGAPDKDKGKDSGKGDCSGCPSAS